MGEVVVPDDEPIPTDWRAAIDARRRAHRAPRCSGTRGSSTSPTIRRSVRTACATSTSRCRRSRRSTCRSPTSSTSSSPVDEYVFGYCLQERNNFDPPGVRTTTEMLGYVKGSHDRATTRNSKRSRANTGSKRRWETIAAALARSRRASAGTSTACSTGSKRASGAASPLNAAPPGGRAPCPRWCPTIRRRMSERGHPRRQRLRYRLLQLWAWLAALVVYRRIDVTGAHHLAGDRPIVLAPNHTNGFADIAVIVAKVRAVPAFRGRGVVVEVCAGRCLLFDFAGVLPIYRGRDGSTKKNVGTFAALHEALAAREPVGSFPKGR